LNFQEVVTFTLKVGEKQLLKRKENKREQNQDVVKIA
jgi:hypothetical protein